MKVVWRQTALQDRARIIAWLRLRNRTAAIRMLREMIAAGDSLASLPERGRRGVVPGVRELRAVRPYVIVYRVEHEHGTVEIIRVWHGVQDRSAPE